MNRNSFIHIFRPSGSLLAAFLILLFIQSCTNPRDKVEHGKLIPEKEFISILSDIYIANGLLSLPAIRYQFYGRDSVSNYIDIVEGHGYTYETMNSTMNYYFNTKPEKLVKIHDRLIREMNEEQSALQTIISQQEEAEGRLSADYNIFRLPDPDRQGEPATDNALSPPCSFRLVFNATIYPDDKSFRPHFAAYLVDADSIETGRKRWLPEIEYFKDGYQYEYIYTGRVESTRPTVMRTIFYNCENDIDEWDKHARIELSSFNFIMDPL